MLREIVNAAQIDGEPRRRWFSGTEMDLYVWYAENGAILQFQICYDKGPDERTLTWHRDDGFAHHKVDSGENRTLHMKSSPVMTDRTGFDIAAIIAVFREAGRKLEYDLHEFIINRLEGYGS
jgi:hypothetical protein